MSLLVNTGPIPPSPAKEYTESLTLFSLVNAIEVAAGYNLLDWSGENWPQVKFLLQNNQQINWAVMEEQCERYSWVVKQWL